MKIAIVHLKPSYRFPALLATILAITSCGRPINRDLSTSKSVDIPQTPVENQYAIGFCWAYATIGFIESQHKIETGEVLNLSEEALGYQRMREELLLIANNYRAGKLSLQESLNPIAQNGLEGWFVRSSDHDPRKDAFELVDQFGVVRESDWSYKFKRESDVTNLRQAILSPFKDLITSQKAITVEAIDQVLTSPNAFPSTPPTSFIVDGKNMSATSYASQILKISSANVVTLQARHASEVEPIIKALKRSMAAGYSVPLSFMVSFNNLNSGFFKAANYPTSELDSHPELTSSLLKIDGGHAVLATDFVNTGGKEGAISASDLQDEVEKDSSKLSYLKFKNSWGFNATRNESGRAVSASDDGYYRIDYGYLKATAALGHLEVVVPIQFAN